MKKYYLLLLFVTSWMNGQVISFTDVNFKNKLLASSTSTTNVIAKNFMNLAIKIDANNNGEIEQTEASAVFYLSVQSSNIQNLEGLQFFTNLRTLYCNNNPLITSLNTASLVNLENLNASNCSLNNVNVNSSTNLKILLLNSNQLTTLNVANLSNLQELSFSYNNINSINLTGFSSLTHLVFYDNLLTSLNTTDLSSLKYLACSGNLLSELNVTNLVNLEFLYFGNPGLSPVYVNNLINLNSLIFRGGGLQTTLDISNLVNLTNVDIRDTNLIELDASNNPNISFFKIIDDSTIEYVNLKNGNAGINVSTSGCPNLEAICINQENVNSLYSSLADIGIMNIVITSYCSFNPGGNYNTITGSMLFDENNNGCDAADLPQPNIKININDGTNQGATFTSNSGNYSFFTQTGSFDITPNVENPSYFNFSPTTATIPFVNNDNNAVTQNFCITPNGIHPDLEVVIVPIIPARPGFDAVYKIVYKNKGNQTVDGYVNFAFNGAVLDYVSASVVPTDVLATTMNWTVPNIAPFQVGTILVTFNVNSPQETPAVNINDILVFDAFIDVNTDETWDDNAFVLNQTVVGSYDPNDITCLEGNALGTTEMGEILHYNIRFENTGTSSAENIVVKNEIDLTQYNIQSLQVMESSHPMTVRVTGNIAEFIFQSIDLDTGGHGNILLKLKSNATLSDDLVINSADIFFDYNFPIITNDEQTVFADLSKNDFNKDVSIIVYPNPAENVIYIKSESTIHSIQMYDAQGRMIQAKLSSNVSEVVNLTNYSSGLYFITVKTEKGIKTQKIIKK
ncbi:DUF7619 domain-containing protein [Flavobacterium tegetincola]|uniref:DUF7619 domain-containing protein n=1 Tax=Flavobacterium tegetincola TaxID=150172 RepID=UPI0003FBF694|nr:T9SS type A sorting domain-containing protein [Flavobacterium tegetincola]